MPCYKIADVTVSITPQSEYFKEMLSPWLTQEEKADLTLPSFSPEREIPDTLRSLSDALLRQFDGLYLHAGALRYKGKVYLFIAPSGTGKSTHLSLWKQHVGEKAEILCGDKPLLRRIDGVWKVYGTPWKGKERQGINDSGILGGLFLLSRGEQNEVAPLSLLHALPELVRSTVFPDDMEGRGKLLELLESLLQSVRLARLTCTQDKRAVDTVKQYIEDNHED